MNVSSTEVQNNFGRYLFLSAKEDIIITKNGLAVAKLCAICDESAKAGAAARMVAEEAAKYGYGGRKGTYQEFLELTRDNEERYEYIDGEIYYLASPKITHQFVLTELVGIFYIWFKGKKCRPYVAPCDITLRRFPEDINVVQPDLMVICDLEEKLNKRDYYMGVPTLVVEIISESTSRKDHFKKLDLYSECLVQEYWIVSPQNREVTVYHMQEGAAVTIRSYKKSETAESCVFAGLTVELETIFR